MRKNLLVATLVGLCVIGMTACSRSEENKPADESNQNTAMTTQQPAAGTESTQAQPAPAQTADNTGNAAPMTTTTTSSSIRVNPRRLIVRKVRLLSRISTPPGCPPKQKRYHIGSHEPPRLVWTRPGRGCHRSLSAPRTAMLAPFWCVRAGAKDPSTACERVWFFPDSSSN